MIYDNNGRPVHQNWLKRIGKQGRGRLVRYDDRYDSLDCLDRSAKTDWKSHIKQKQKQTKDKTIL